MDEDDANRMRKAFKVTITNHSKGIREKNRQLLALLDLCEDMAVYTTHRGDCTSPSCVCGLDNILQRYSLLNVIRTEDKQ